MTVLTNACLLQSFFEAASLMSQIAHKHLLLVYGISVHKSKSECHSSVNAYVTSDVKVLLRVLKVDVLL